MKRRYLAINLVVGLLLSTSCSGQPELFGESPQVSIPTEEARAISLKALQARLRSCQPEKNCPSELLSLAGINTILGFIIDEGNNDLVLYGQSDPVLPQLHLEDFVVALRNAWLKYARLEGNTRYYAYPGCSIDPAPQVMQELQRIEPQIASSRSVGETERALAAWRGVCQRPQAVRVMGIPFDTHFARVMVKADYDMKSLADGNDALDTPGFISMTEMALREASRAVVQRQPISQSLAGLNRFWFYPGENVFETDQGTVFIKQSPVKLLTEQMYSNARGQMIQSGAANPRAQRFADNFTAVYAQTAQRRPIYRELENLFRFVALAGMIKSSATASLDLSYLLEEFAVPPAEVSKSLPGRYAVKDWKHEEKDAQSITTLRLWFPSCGGVNIAIDERMRKTERNPSGKLQTFGKNILSAKPSPDVMSWSYKDTDNTLFDLKDGARLQSINQANPSSPILTVEYQTENFAVYDGSATPFYSGRDPAALIKLVEERHGAEYARSPNFDYKNFSDNKIAAFQSNYGRDLGDRLFRRRQGSIDARELLHTPGVSLKQESGRIEQETSGPRQGLFKLVIKFLVQIKEKTYEITMTVWTRTMDQAQFYWVIVQQHFSGPDLKVDSLDGCVRQWDALFKRQHPGASLQKRYESEFGPIDISRLKRVQSQEAG